MSKSRDFIGLNFIGLPFSFGYSLSSSSQNRVTHFSHSQIQTPVTMNHGVSLGYQIFDVIVDDLKLISLRSVPDNWPDLVKFP